MLKLVAKCKDCCYSDTEYGYCLNPEQQGVIILENKPPGWCKKRVNEVLAIPEKRQLRSFLTTD